MHEADVRSLLGAQPYGDHTVGLHLDSPEQPRSSEGPRPVALTAGAAAPRPADRTEGQAGPVLGKGFRPRVRRRGCPGGRRSGPAGRTARRPRPRGAARRRRTRPARRARCRSVRCSSPARRMFRIRYSGSSRWPRWPLVSCCTRRRTSSTTWVASLTTWNASRTATGVARAGHRWRSCTRGTGPRWRSATPARNASPRSVQPGLVRLPGAAGDQVQQPSPDAAVLIAGQVDHPGQLLRAAPAVLDRLGRHVVPHVLVDPEDGDARRSGTRPRRPAAAAAGSSSTPCASRCPSWRRDPVDARRARGGSARSPTGTPAPSASPAGRRPARPAPRTSPTGQPGVRAHPAPLAPPDPHRAAHRRARRPAAPRPGRGRARRPRRPGSPSASARTPP